jgi:hypothetical protein
MTLLALLVCGELTAQIIPEARKRGIPNLPDYDRKPIHFGFLVGFNMLDFHLYNTGVRNSYNNHTAWFADVATLKPGLNLGIVTDFRLHQHLNFRILPGISFGERNITFIDELGELPDEPLKIKSTYIEVPFLLKYSAYRLGNFKPYLIGGTTIRYDLAKDKQSHLQLKSLDDYLDIGAGMDFYLPYFRMSIELRASFGLCNIYNETHSDEIDDIPYQQTIDEIKGRFYGITFYFE